MTHSTKHLLSLALALGIGSLAVGQELLSAGDFEGTIAGGEVPGWTLEEFRTGDPLADVNSASLVGFANSDFDLDPGLGLWLRAFVGNPDDGTAEAILSQTVPGTPGETYTFSGEAEFEQNYAGGVATLDPLSSSGAVASPTESLFRLEFLDAGGAVIGAPIVGDVANDVFNGFGYASVTPVSGVAPAGTAEVRVSAIGSQLIQNIDPGQSAFYDNFSLTASSNPATELLENGDLNDGPPTIEDVLGEFFEFIEDPDTADTLSLAGFANNPDSGGSNGVWVRPFIDGIGATVQQTVAGSAGSEYTFSAAARWEVNYFGDGITDENETLIELAFLDEGGAVIDSAVLDLRDDGKIADNEWSTHSVSATAPAGTVDVRVAGIVNNLTNNEENPGGQSAFWDDFSLMLATAGLPGDANGDGSVDLLDLDILGANFGTMGTGTNATGDFNGDGNVDLLDLDILGANFGSGGSSAAVPEPVGVVLAAFGVVVAATRRRV
ncbi:MAG: dockerin type I domain-containing protein [Planctomycetota bacterium]